jgi:hypothetical protein
VGEPKRIELGGEHSGIVIEYIKRRDALVMWGYYDTYVGIQGDTLSVDEFCEKLGIRRDKRGKAQNQSL